MTQALWPRQEFSTLLALAKARACHLSICSQARIIRVWHNLPLIAYRGVRRARFRGKLGCCNQKQLYARVRSRRVLYLRQMTRVQECVRDWTPAEYSTFRSQGPTRARPLLRHLHGGSVDHLSALLLPQGNSASKADQLLRALNCQYTAGPPHTWLAAFFVSLRHTDGANRQARFEQVVCLNTFLGNIILVPLCDTR